MMVLIRIYQVALSPWLAPSCRFTPTCSQYALEAFKIHPFFKALRLSLKRLWSCRPGGGRGYDPVPPASGSGARQSSLPLK
ncbi:MAG: membrane protein insertion efficiency factor YidD [Flavobacteriales bacterium]|nr:membrane protein insertion efficiency factor YidD [Flavobacteriales bacterium]